MKMRKMIVGAFVMLGIVAYGHCASVFVGAEIEKGDARADFNVTISSYTTTAILTASQAIASFDIGFVNHGSYSVYMATYSIADTSATYVREIKPNESLSFEGRNYFPLYLLTAKGTSYTARIDGSRYFKQ